MRKDFDYRAAVLDWATRRVLSGRRSNRLTPGFCIEAVEETFHRHGTPEIVNTDPGSPSRSEYGLLLYGKDVALQV
jgi:putative transposase